MDCLPTLTRRALLAGLPLTAALRARHRVVVSTDIGGTDPDDFQSMVHLLLYADVLELEGLVSSPYGPGRREHLLQVIDRYAQDFPVLRGYPKPDSLRAIAKQGAFDSPGPAGIGASTEGSDWIVRCARKKDPRPLWVLVWGGIEDLAQALHDAPDILPKLRVYFIGGPNKMWSVDAYHYIEQNHPDLWMIESNATYRGWFTGGEQSGEWGNREFVSRHIAGRGALGEYFATHLRGTIKMGDTPSVAYLLNNARPEDPSRPSWGGRYVRIWDGRRTVFDRLTTEADEAEAFGVVEFVVPGGPDLRMLVDNRISLRGALEASRIRFRFAPRDAKVWPYRLSDGREGKFTAVPPPMERTRQASRVHRNWWIDDPDPAAAEGVHPGAKSVNRWRVAFLQDFAERLGRCRSRRG